MVDPTKRELVNQLQHKAVKMQKKHFNEDFAAICSATCLGPLVGNWMLAILIQLQNTEKETTTPDTAHSSVACFDAFPWER